MGMSDLVVSKHHSSKKRKGIFKNLSPKDIDGLRDLETNRDLNI